MKAPGFKYFKPAALDEALHFLHKHGDAARVLAGGQSLLATLNLRLSAPDWLVDISGISLRGITCHGDTVRIGATTTHRDIERSAVVHERLPLLALAVPHIAHQAIRSRGTLGGSLALADPAAEWPAVVLALNAAIEIRSLEGSRTVMAEDYFKGLYETDLQAGEILTGIAFKCCSDGDRHYFRELSRRNGDYASAGIAAVRSGGQVRFVLFGVGVMPLLYKADASEALPDMSARFHSALESMEIVGDLFFSAASKRKLARELFERACIELGKVID